MHVGRKIAHTGRPLSYSFSSLSLFCKAQIAVVCACGQQQNTKVLAVVVQAQQEQLTVYPQASTWRIYMAHVLTMWHTCSAEAHTCNMLRDLVLRDDGHCQCNMQNVSGC